MAYFTFSEQTASRAIKWMCREFGYESDYDLAQQMVESFMLELGYDECLGLSSARENLLAKHTSCSVDGPKHDYKPVALEHYRCTKCGREMHGMLATS